MVSKDH